EDRLAERSTAQIDEPARLAARHYSYYRGKVLHAQAEWFGPAEQELLTWPSRAWSDIRRAIDTSIATRKPVVGCKSASAWCRFARRPSSVRCRRSASASSRLWRQPMHRNPS